MRADLLVVDRAEAEHVEGERHRGEGPRREVQSVPEWPEACT